MPRKIPIMDEKTDLVPRFGTKEAGMHNLDMRKNEPLEKEGREG